MGFFLFMALLGNFMQYQNSFENCKAEQFKPTGCEWHKKVLEKNPGSMHYKK